MNRTGTPQEAALAARAVEPQSGRTMEVYTTEPGIQLYTANGLDGTLAAFAARLTTAFRVMPGNPALSRLAQPPRIPFNRAPAGETYRQLTVHKFGVA